MLNELSSLMSGISSLDNLQVQASVLIEGLLHDQTLLHTVLRAFSPSAHSPPEDTGIYTTGLSSFRVG
jgi:hypothetical protein